MNKEIISLLPLDEDGHRVVEVLGVSSNTITIETNSTDIPSIVIEISQLELPSCCVVAVGSKFRIPKLI